MIPDLERKMNDELDKASLKELIPDFSNDTAWEQLSHRLPAAKKKRSFLRAWSYAAAILILIATGYLTKYMTDSYTPQTAASGQLPGTSTVTATTIINDTNTPGPDRETSYPTAEIKKPAAPHKVSSNGRKYAANSAIYNGTPCPIELRINQTMRCPNNKPKAITSCSTLEPDQSAQLNYKETHTLAKDCSLTIKEIEIRSIATGEVILLTANSTPSTAQEVFGYITREKEGDVLAGVFNHDCDKKNRKHNLRLDNRDGNLVLQ